MMCDVRVMEERREERRRARFYLHTPMICDAM
jgi:hypothetical protein